MIAIEELARRRVLFWRFIWCAMTAVILLAGIVIWRERFQCTCSTDELEFAVLGIERDGEVLRSFAGTSFVSKLQKMGLAFKAGSAEAHTNFAEYYFGDGDRANEMRNVPFVWIFARPTVERTKDLGYKTRGEALFSGDDFAFSIVDPATKFAQQLDPESFTIFHAKTGDAIAAIPVLSRPAWNENFGDDFDENWLLRIETKVDGKWRKLGEFPCKFRSRNDEIDIEEYNQQKMTDDELEELAKLPVPAMTARVESLTFPRNLRTFSTPRERSPEFGKMEISLAGTQNPQHWQLENFALGSMKSLCSAAGRDDCEPTDIFMFWPTDPQQIGMSAPDRFHTNVRFLENENFETRDGNVLVTPIAKSLFPRAGDAWGVVAKIVKTRGFGDGEILPEEKIKLSRGASKKIAFAGRTIRTTAYLDPKYFRILKGAPPALVIEVADLPMVAKLDSTELFWVPENVRTDAEILVPESVVIVRPGVYQYWFLPTKPVKELFVRFAVSRVIEAHGVVEPEIED